PIRVSGGDLLTRHQPAVVIQQPSAGWRIVACGAARFMLRQECGLRAREPREQDNGGERQRHPNAPLNAGERNHAKAALGAEARRAKAIHARLMVSTLLANNVLNRRKDAGAGPFITVPLVLYCEP